MKPRTVGTPEQLVQRVCLEYLRARHIVHWRVNVRGVPGRKATNVGMWDVIAVYPGGAFWAIEFKAGDAVLSPGQIEFGQAVMNAGGVCTVARCVDDLLRALGDKRIEA